MYLCIYVSMYLCLYVSMYLCIYVSMYLYTYVYIYIVYSGFMNVTAVAFLSSESQAPAGAEDEQPIFLHLGALPTTSGANVGVQNHLDLGQPGSLSNIFAMVQPYWLRNPVFSSASAAIHWMFNWEIQCSYVPWSKHAIWSIWTLYAMVYGGYGHPIGIGKKKIQWIDDDDHPSPTKQVVNQQNPRVFGGDFDILTTLPILLVG